MAGAGALRCPALDTCRSVETCDLLTPTTGAMARVDMPALVKLTHDLGGVALTS